MLKPLRLYFASKKAFAEASKRRGGRREGFSRRAARKEEKRRLRASAGQRKREKTGFCEAAQRQRRDERLGARGRACASARRQPSARWINESACESSAENGSEAAGGARLPYWGTTTTRVANVAAVGATARSSTLGNSTSHARFRGTRTHW